MSGMSCLFIRLSERTIGFSLSYLNPKVPVTKTNGDLNIAFLPSFLIQPMFVLNPPRMRVPYDFKVQRH